MPEIEKIRTQSLNNCVGCWFILRPYVLIWYVTRLPRNLCVCILNHVWWQSLHLPSWRFDGSFGKARAGVRGVTTWIWGFQRCPAGPAFDHVWNFSLKFKSFFSTVLVDLLAVSDGIDSIDMVNSSCLKPMCQCAIDFPKDQETEPGFLQSKQRWQARMRSEWQGASTKCCT